MELGFITSKRDMDIIRRDLDKYAKYIIESITGENLGGTTVKVDTKNYHDSGVFFKAKRDLPTYVNDQFSKNLNGCLRKVLCLESEKYLSVQKETLMLMLMLTEEQSE